MPQEYINHVYCSKCRNRTRSHVKCYEIENESKDDTYSCSAKDPEKMSVKIVITVGKDQVKKSGSLFCFSVAPQSIV